MGMSATLMSGDGDLSKDLYTTLSHDLVSKNNLKVRDL